MKSLLAGDLGALDAYDSVIQAARLEYRTVPRQDRRGVSVPQAPGPLAETSWRDAGESKV